MSKRILIAVTVDDDVETDSLAMAMPPEVGRDATVWEWDDFWLDVADDVIGETWDKTMDEGTDVSLNDE